MGIILIIIDNGWVFGWGGVNYPHYYCQKAITGQHLYLRAITTSKVLLKLFLHPMYKHGISHIV
jgi:hypothetical protein